MKQVNWGIIGCGDVTEVKSGPAFNLVQDSKLIAVMRRDYEKALDYANRHGVPKVHRTAADLIHDPEINAIYIATPPAQHLPYMKMVAEASKPVYIEKTMARTHAECKEMNQIAATNQISLHVAYYRRALPRFLQVKTWLDEGRIGTVRAVNIRLYGGLPDNLHDLPWRALPELAGGGWFIDLGSHTLDILDFLLGPICQVNARAKNLANAYPAEDLVAGSFEFENGAIGSGLWCFCSGAKVETNEIIGSNGMIRFSSYGEEPFELLTSSGTEKIKIENPKHIQEPMIQSVVDSILGRGSCKSTGESASRTAWVMDEFLKEYYPERHFPESPLS